MFRALLLSLLIFSSVDAYAALPSSVSKTIGVKPAKIGDMQYRKLGFSIYRATLWSKDGVYNPDQPYALQIHYLRSLSKSTVVESVVGDIKKQKKADDATMAKWEKTLGKALPAVKNGDEVVALSEPGKSSRIYFNGKQIANIADKRLSDSFFNIWLGDVSDANMRAQLTGTSEKIASKSSH